MSDLGDPGVDLVVEEDTDLREPPMFKVLLHNDHYTTQEFVVEVLRRVFQKSLIDATRIMLDVHRKGIGTVGVYTYDVARSRIARVKALAEEAKYPLKCSMEEA